VPVSERGEGDVSSECLRDHACVDFEVQAALIYLMGGLDSNTTAAQGANKVRGGALVVRGDI
jgi:hypothetical protein